MKSEAEHAENPIVVLDPTPDGIMKTARTLKQPFTAEELCKAMFKSTWGMGSWVSGYMRPLLRTGRILKTGKNKRRQTLYQVATDEG